MLDQWYYGRGSDITGPMTGPELSALAQGGTILTTDTIWRDGVEGGVPAGTVKDLYTAGLAIHHSAIPDAAETVVDVPMPQRVEPKKGRATAGKGAVIVGQDGKTVKFRMKCTECKHEDSSWKSIAIPRGGHRAHFYCPKCRKKRDAEINGYW